MSEHQPKGTARPYDPHADLRFVRAEGCHVWDSSGNRYFDAISGYSTTNFGHAHPRLLHSLQDQASTIAFALGGQTPWREKLEDSLASLMPPKSTTRVWLNTGGARAIETAWRIAQVAKPGGVARMDLAYHGRSIATSLISDTARVDIAPPHLLNVTIPFPRTRFDAQVDRCVQCIASLETAEALFMEYGERLSCLILEPAIGSRGYFFAPTEYFRRLIGLAKKHALVVIADEIQMGLGRLGWNLSSIADEWNPDLVAVGKSLGGGLVPIAAILGRSELIDALPIGIDSETYAAMPLACRIGCTTLELLNQEGFLESVRIHGDTMRRLLQIQLPDWIEVDGRGLATVLSIRKDHPQWVTDESVLFRNWVVQMREHGLLVHLTGPARDRIALIPPLIADSKSLEPCIDSISRSWNALKLEKNSLRG